MPSVMKRPGAHVAGAAKKVKAAPVPVVKRDPFIVSVEEGIESCEISRSAQQMLCSMLEIALGAFKENRDEYMSSAVNMIGETLNAQVDKLDKDIIAAQKDIDDQSEVCEATRGKISKIQEDVSAHQAVVLSTKKELASSAEDYQKAKVGVAALKDEALFAEAKLEEQKGKQDILDLILIECIEPLSSESVERGSEEAREKLDRLLSTLKGAKFDDSLVTALPTVLAKPSAERGTFDVMVLTQLKAEITSRADAFKALSDGAEAARTELNQKIQNASDLYANCNRAQLAAASAYTDSKTTEAKLDEHLKETRKALSSESKVARGYADRFELLTRELKNLKDGGVAAFAHLEEKTAPPPPPEAAVIEDAEMKDAAGSPRPEETLKEIVGDDEVMTIGAHDDGVAVA